MNPVLSSLRRWCLQPGVVHLPPGAGGCFISLLSESVLPAHTPPCPHCSERSGELCVVYWAETCFRATEDITPRAPVSLPSVSAQIWGVGMESRETGHPPVPAVVSHPTPPVPALELSTWRISDITPDYTVASGPDRLLKMIFPAQMLLNMFYILCALLDNPLRGIASRSFTTE